jgi:branched-chain amino acid transport system substrate-binding protein
MAAGHLMPPYVETLGPDAEYTLAVDSFALDEGQSKPMVKVVNDMHRERYGTDFSGETALPFMGMLTMADAINRAGSVDPEAIRQALRETDIPADQIMGALAGIKFDPETGQNLLGAKFILQILDGQYRIVWPFDRATADLVWPMPKWSER